MRHFQTLIIAAMIFIAATNSASGQKTIIRYLSGTGSNNTVDWDFFCTAGQNSGKWTKIAVPSCWEQQGFGNYNYGYDPEEKRFTEKGLYKFTFDVPNDWSNKVIQIVFDGVMTDAEVKINGKLAGPIHQGAFYRFKYDITKLVKPGKQNTLEVSVAKVSSNQSVNLAERHADYWVFGGIFRPVYLEVLPSAHMSSVAINADMFGNFNCEVNLSNNHGADRILAQLYTSNNQKVGNQLDINIKNSKNGLLKTQIANAHLWTAETPNLYKVELTLISKGKVVHTLTEKFGFRSIELIERDGVYLNGTKIKFKGVNRHSFWPTTGRTLNYQLMLNDAKLIKEMNMNAVRNSHYPADKQFYDICDSLGIMVLDELAGWHDAYDTSVGKKLVNEMMAVSRNNPSVIMWVNGNEGGHNHLLVPTYYENDIQKRPVIHAWEIFNGADTQHYRDYNYGVGNHFQGHEVVFPTEFLHGVYDGGHGAGLEDFWKLMWDNPLSAGGFLWNFADEGIVRTDRNNMVDTDGNHGADGIVGPYHEREGSFYTIKEVWSPIYFDKKEITTRFDGTLTIENRYHFTNLNQCRFTWKLHKVKRPNLVETNQNATGIAAAPNVEPLQKGFLKIPLPNNWQQYDILYVTAFNPDGSEIFTWSWPITLPVTMAKNIVTFTGTSQPVVSQDAHFLKVKTAGIEVKFDKNSGLLAMVENQKGIVPINNGPTLCEGNTLFKSLTHNYEGDNLVIKSEFDAKSNLTMAVWTIYPSGWMQLDVQYNPETEQHIMLGINFDCADSLVKSMEWLGDGPYRVWKNRIKGNSLGVWTKNYNNTITGQGVLEYPEFKGYHSRMYWLTVQTAQQPFTVVSPQEDIFFRMLTPQWPEKPFNTDPPFPSGNISFMHGISAMGTKQFTPERMGPMSQKNIYYHYERQRPLKMTLYFDFRAQ